MLCCITYDAMYRLERGLEMKKIMWLGAVAGYALFVLSIDARGEGPPKHQLSSIEECNRKYERSVLAQSKNGLECFSGRRKGLNPKYPPIAEQLYVFDTKNLQVWPLISEQISGHEIYKWGVGGAAFDSSGTKLAVTPIILQGPQMVQSWSIIVIDLQTLNCDLLVADGWLNYNPSFSPDGRYIAYYATDRRTNPILDRTKPLTENAGRIVNVQTKEVTTITEPIVMGPTFFCCEQGYYAFRPPEWLDNDRVLFSTVATDGALLRKYVPGFSGSSCAYMAVANVTTREVRRLFAPRPPGRFPAAEMKTTIDQEAKRITFSRGELVIRTDFDLNR